MKKKIMAGICVAGAVLVLASAVRWGWSISMRAPAYRQKGAEAARVTILEYSDFQCPMCARSQETVKALLKRHEGKVLLVFRHFPLRMHKWARQASFAAEAAGLQGKFWEYHDLLFARQKDWSDAADVGPIFSGYAKELGLDVARFQSDMAGPRVAAAVQRDLDEGAAQAVNVTPSFLIGKRRLVGESQLTTYGDQYIQLELGAAGGK